MYVRDARNRDEVWLLDHIEAMGLDDAAFRSRDYVIAVDEESNERAGFGRIRLHKDPDVCELTGIGVLEAWRGQGVGGHVVERLIQKAGDDGFDEVFSITDQPEYLKQFGFKPVDLEDLPDPIRDRLGEKRETVSEDVVPMKIGVDEFGMPSRFRERFKTARQEDDSGGEPEETPEDFGIDPDEATYKYDTGGN